MDFEIGCVHAKGRALADAGDAVMCALMRAVQDLDTGGVYAEARDNLLAEIQIGRGIAQFAPALVAFLHCASDRMSSAELFGGSRDAALFQQNPDGRRGELAAVAAEQMLDRYGEAQIS